MTDPDFDDDALDYYDRDTLIQTGRSVALVDMMLKLTDHRGDFGKPVIPRDDLERIEWEAKRRLGEDPR